VLQIAFLTVGLLLAYQLVVTLLRPVWIGPVTDWLQALVAWSGLLVVVLVSLWFTRTVPRQSRSLWWVSAGLLSYAVARTLWLMEDQFLFPHQVSYPSWSDLFFLLQYPCYVLALLLLPRVRPRLQQTLVVLDASLLLGAALALSWYFLLAPIYQSSHESGLAKLVNLSYPVGDLAIFFSLTLIWLRYREYESQRPVLALLLVAIPCLLVADSWNALLLLNTSSYRTGSPPDLFWLVFYLLLPLAGLVRFRLTQRELAGVGARPSSQQPADLRRQDLIAGLRVTSPVAAAWLAGTVLIIRADLMSTLHPLVPPLIALGLLGLALVRQGLTAVENARLRREREDALRESTAQMETFLSVAGHELKNPLASLKLSLQLAVRRLRQLSQREPETASGLEPVLENVARAERQEHRVDRLVDELLDASRIQAGKLELHLEPTDLVAIVSEVVEEQSQLSPLRTLCFECPRELHAPVLADADRIGEVVTNYLTNALKYSSAETPVEVGVQVETQQAKVWVRDHGPGLSPEEQERIWERFYRTCGIEVQSGTGVGLGLGLHISRIIIEQHHGQVGVQSAPGKGSTFWFSLPLTTREQSLPRSQADAPES
jgi:signal transduction histidine kinase